MFVKYRILMQSNIYILTPGHCRFRLFSSYKKYTYAECFKLLGIPSNSDQLVTRDAFLNLTKKFHPDSCHEEASADKFQEIEIAYRTLLGKFAKERHNLHVYEGEFGLYYENKKGRMIHDDHEEMTSEFIDIKHTAPQHRQYLSYDGIGSGTPFQRQKQFVKYKAATASESASNYKFQKLFGTDLEASLVEKDKLAAQKIKTGYGIERLVEDMIQESMARGDFDNLPNAGKPLSYQNYNPFVDSATHKLNQLLIDNGYAPEWVILEKEIREERHKIKTTLSTERLKLGPGSLPDSRKAKWNKIMEKCFNDANILNKKIDKYNLLVPVMTKQMIHFSVAKEANTILNEAVKETITSEKQQCEEKSQKIKYPWFLKILNFG